MRNVFDQYSQPENRVTHALLTALHEDRLLLGSFLRDLLNLTPPKSPRDLQILAQRFPEDDPLDEAEAGRLGIPDGWILDDDGWCILIENKVTAPLTIDQLERHQRTAERRGFETITVVAITAVDEPRVHPGILYLQWRQVYAWLCRQPTTRDWASRAAAYLEITEARLIDDGQLTEGALTMFSGIPFGADRTYTYLEAKRLLGLAMKELRLRKDLVTRLGMRPDQPGRPAITGKDNDHVWDFLSVSHDRGTEGFTSSPHLTLGIGRAKAETTLTIPNAINRQMRRNFISGGIDRLRNIVAQMLELYQPLLECCPGASPRCRAVQRRYPSQRAIPYFDTLMEFDLRTAVELSGGPKFQPVWLQAVFDAFCDKHSSNFQLQFGIVFEYSRCSALASETALELFAQGWLGTKPVLDALLAPPLHAMPHVDRFANPVTA